MKRDTTKNPYGSAHHFKSNSSQVFVPTFT